MSTQVKAAKDALDLAITNYKYHVAMVKRTLKSSSPNERSLSNKLQGLTEALASLNIAHTTWVSKSQSSSSEEHPSEDSPYTSQWLESCWDEVDDLQTQVDCLLQENSPSKPTGEQQLEILDQQLQSLQNSISTKLSKLLEKTTPTSSAVTSITPASHTILSNLLSSVQQQLSSELSSISERFISLQVPDAVKRCASIEEFRRSKEEDLVVIQLRLADLSSPASPSPPSTSTVPHRSIEMEKSIAPSFSGSVLDYPEFKRSWAKVAAVHWDDGNQVEQIKHKVNPETRLLISQCSTMVEVWKILDVECANEQDVLNAVDIQINKLKSMDCSIPEYIVKLRRYLPYLEEALKGVDGLDYLQSPDRVNLLLQKFDERTLHEWDYFRSKSKGSTYERFFKFLLDRYDASKSCMARSKAASLFTNNSGQSINHTSSKGRDTTTKHPDGDCRKCRTFTARDHIYTCPGCGRGTPVGARIHHCLEHCGAYMAMDVDSRGACVERANWCPIHLIGTHTLSDCNKTSDPGSLCGINGCSKHHHQTLHGGSTPFLASIMSTGLADPFHQSPGVLLSIQSIPSNNGSVHCLYDGAATCSLITSTAAQRLGLKGEPIKLSISTVNGTKFIDSNIYHVPLIDQHKGTHVVKAFQVESISDPVPKVDISSIKHLFPPNIHKIWQSLACRPVGNIDVLLGTEVLGLHPIIIEERDNLRILLSRFGSGHLISGSHASIKHSNVNLSEDVSHIRFASASVNRISVKPLYEYFDSDNLGIEPPRRCGNCRNCKDCSFRGQMLSQQEQYEYQVLESKLTYEPSSQTFIASYPFTSDPSILPDNKAQVIKIAQRLEHRLQNSQYLPAFNAAFDKMIQYGALRELTESEIALWDGPVHYVSLQHVINEESATTPLRIVTNSSLSDRKGLSLNSILMKGPDTLSDQWAVLNKWRSYEVALCSDITKAYYSLRTGELEKHVRRVVWRYGDTTSKWKIFGFQTVSFGDRPAAAFLEIALRRTAENHQFIDPLAATRISNDRYVDDLATGGSKSEVSRFQGNELSDHQFDGTIPNILSKGSFQLKVMVSSGETDSNKISKLGGKVLGIPWDPTLDKIAIQFPVYLTTPSGLKIMLNNQNVQSFDTKLLTPLNLLSIVNSVYDPLGLVAPITVRLRVAFRNLFKLNPPLQWDRPLETNPDILIWLDLIGLLVSSSSISFPRYTKPPEVIGNCQLICFFDGSDLAYAAVIYIRWLLQSGDVYVGLLCAKPRVTPLKRMSTPRSELNGAVVASRLCLCAVRSLATTGVTPETVWMIGDSECTLASLEKVNAPFGEYFGNRIGEIQDNQAKIEKFCRVGKAGEWYHTSSVNNGADQATRIDSSAADISENSTWQLGPSYLKLPLEHWPINRDFSLRKEACIPESEVLKRFRCIIQVAQTHISYGIHCLIDPYSTNSWERLIRRTQLLLIPFRPRNAQVVSQASLIQSAKRLWFISAMPDTLSALDSGRLRELDIQVIDGLQVVHGRASHGLQRYFGSSYLPVLMATSRVAFLIMLHAHSQDHAGRDITVSMSRHEAWIVNAKQLAKQIIRQCVRCRYLRKQTEEQKMAVLPDIMQMPCPPFTNIGLDLLGPITVKAMTNKRSTMKTWVVLFLCLNTKAISMELAPGYSTNDFLIAYTTHISYRGTPSFIHSDRGSQLVSAQKGIEETLNYDWDLIISSTSKEGTTWQFAPAGAQWRNGATEAFVKKFKLSFYHLYKGTRFNFSELNCAIKRIANILNDRPVSAQRSSSYNSDIDFLTPLTPNMLLTGRNASHPPCNYADIDDVHLRQSYIEELEGAWWFQYKVQCFDSLVPTRKWLDAKRNICVDDIVLIKYSAKSIPGSYRLGRVTKVVVDNDNLVRTCTVKYHLIKPITDANATTVKDVTLKEVCLPIQRLILIVPVEEQ